MSKIQQTNFVIFDPKNNLFWERTSHYGWVNGNTQLFAVRFTKEISKASQLNQQQAKEVIDFFETQQYIIERCSLEIDTISLEIRELQITYELK